MEIDYEDMGRRIRQARQEKSLTQEKLAEAVGVNPTHISHIENGKGQPSLEVILKIINRLEIEPNWVFCGSVETTKATLLKETEMIFEDCDSRQVRKLNRLLKAIKEEIKEEL